MIIIAYLETTCCGCGAGFNIRQVGGNSLVSCPQCNFSESDHGKNMARHISALNPITRAQVLHNKIDFSVYCAAEPK